MIKLTQDEAARLTKISDRDHVVQLSFGPSGTWLDPAKCPWAAELVSKWRAFSREGDG